MLCYVCVESYCIFLTRQLPADTLATVAVSNSSATGSSVCERR